ncbi:MAG: site-2 protease family protein [Clostridiales bacterium]|nr:site-2 protease family protein [Clostridiales bacterium]
MFDLLRNGFTVQVFINLLVRVFIIFCVLPFHEYAHALLATKQGDPTAKLSGRLTLNPLAHIDPIGAVMIFFAGFGYAKPVPVNIRNFKNPKKGMAITALAGPVSNLLLAFISIIFMNLVALISDATIVQVTILFLYYNAVININLAVFNLLPIPPLDGSRLLAVILPDKYYYKVMQNERMLMIIILVLIFTGVITRPLMFLSGAVYKALSVFVGLFFKLF